MEKNLLDYFDKLEDYFINYSELDTIKIKEIITKTREKRIHLGSKFNRFDPYTLFDCLCVDLGFSCTLDKDGRIEKKFFHRDRLYELLEEYGYYYNNDIKIALQKFQKSPLADEKFASSFISNGRSGYKNIQNFESDGQYIYITDASDFTYTIINLNNYDMQNDMFKLSRISHLITNGMKNDCHNYASQIAQLLPEGEIVTSACPRFMKGNYYLHSYVEYNGYIIDLTLNIMMPKEQYYHLMGPIELSRTKNTDILNKKLEIEAKIGNLEDLGRANWSYVVYIAFLNIMSNPELLNNFTQELISSNVKH